MNSNRSATAIGLTTILWLAACGGSPTSPPAVNTPAPGGGSGGSELVVSDPFPLNTVSTDEVFDNGEVRTSPELVWHDGNQTGTIRPIPAGLPIPSPLEFLIPMMDANISPGSMLTVAWRWIGPEPPPAFLAGFMECRYPWNQDPSAGGWGMEFFSVRTGRNGGHFRSAIPCTAPTPLVCWMQMQAGRDVISTNWVAIGPKFNLVASNKPTCNNSILWLSGPILLESGKVGETARLLGYYLPPNTRTQVRITIQTRRHLDNFTSIQTSSSAGELIIEVPMKEAGYYTAFMKTDDPQGLSNTVAWAAE